MQHLFQPISSFWTLCHRRLRVKLVFTFAFFALLLAVALAAGMQRDLSDSVAGTAGIIALLFWLTHRRWLPMLWLLTLLALILMATLALGGLVLGTISVVSMGFAAILLGLAVDDAVVHYQEALAHPQLSVPEIRRAVAPVLQFLWELHVAFVLQFCRNVWGKFDLLAKTIVFLDKVGTPART
jgi:hypothetical protein